MNRPPENNPLPFTDNLCEGEVVPKPKLFETFITDDKFPAVSKISKIFAICPETGCKARVVVAIPAPLTLPTDNFAYGVVVPIPTRFVVDASLIYPPSVAINDQLVSLPLPPAEAAAQVKFPLTSVCKKLPATIEEGHVYVWLLNLVVPPTDKVPVAIKFATDTSPENNPLP